MNIVTTYELAVYIMLSPIFMFKVHLSCHSICSVLFKFDCLEIITSPPCLPHSRTHHPFCYNARLEIFLPSHPAKLKFHRSSTRVIYIYRTSREHLMHMARAFFQERLVLMTTSCRLLHHCRCVNSLIVLSREPVTIRVLSGENTIEVAKLVCTLNTVWAACGKIISCSYAARRVPRNCPENVPDNAKLAGKDGSANT
jgi:hypothetical protein